jgi:hypothetical protein
MKRNERNRNGYKWSVNEILQLQRESELLELSVLEMAKIHKRSVDAIEYKLASEGFSNYINLDVNVNVNVNSVVKRREPTRMKLRSSLYKNFYITEKKAL